MDKGHRAIPGHVYNAYKNLNGEPTKLKMLYGILSFSEESTPVNLQSLKSVLKIASPPSAAAFP